MKKQKTETGPSKWQMSQLSPAIGEITSVYNQNKGAVGDIASGVQGLIPGLTDRFTQGDPNVNAARGYNSDVLSGKYLTGNPFLQQIIDQTSNDVMGAVGGKFGGSGSFGGTKYYDALGKGLGEAIGGLRYSDYNTQMGRMDQAAGQAGSFGAADNQNLAALLQVAQAGTSLPFAAANNYGSLIGSLVGNSGQSKSSDGGASTLGSALTAAALAFSDRRLKSSIEQVGSFPDGLGIYEYDIFGERQRGVMADEVGQLRPWALGPVIGGYQTVNYEAL